MPFSGSTILMAMALVLVLSGAAIGAIIVGGIACLVEAYIIFRSGQA